MVKFRICILSIFISVCHLKAQNESSKWYFGNKRALDFSTNPPTPILTSSMKDNRGCSSIADASGSLLFYTSGDTIWNQANNVMANGTGLLGGIQGRVLIAKQPGNNSIYFVFT